MVNQQLDHEIFSSVFAKMCSPRKLDRDKAADNLRQIIPHAELYLLDNVLQLCTTNLDSQINCEDWHTLYGCLVTYRLVVELRQDVSVGDQNALHSLLQLCCIYVSHTEPRVRVAVGELLGILCQRCGVVVFECVWPRLSALITAGLQTEDSINQSARDEEVMNDSASVMSRDSADVFASTCSWTQLETSLRCLERLIACGLFTVPPEAVELVFAALDHSNRFVRESVFVCLSAFLLKSDQTQDSDEACRVDLSRYSNQISDAIARGMDDNWSQVRMSASVACRRLLCYRHRELNPTVFHSALIPRVCLNRYYVAEGVKNYNQQTWEIISENRGRELVRQNLDEIVKHYLRCTSAENHAVREAACYCVSELVRKLPPEAIADHVSSLLEALLVCFHDDSWPVRDTACLAVGSLVPAFSDASAPYMDRLLPLMFDSVFDNIPSVRQGGAESLALVASACPQLCHPLISKRLSEDLERVREQTDDESSGVELEPVAGTWGENHVVRRLRGDTAASDRHTDQTMYSCGSLAPKMRAGGCSASHHFRRDARPWELSDGCIRLVAELSQSPAFHQLVLHSLPSVARAATCRHYSQHVQLISTVCYSLVRIAHALGKRSFKTHLELFIDTIFYAVNCDNRLTADCAVSCVQNLSKFLGAGIFRGRVQLHNPRYLDTLDRVVPPV